MYTPQLLIRAFQRLQLYRHHIERPHHRLKLQQDVYLEVFVVPLFMCKAHLYLLGIFDKVEWHIWGKVAEIIKNSWHLWYIHIYL